MQTLLNNGYEKSTERKIMTSIDNPTLYDTIIVGGGIAGLTAAIYSARANQKTLVLSGGITDGTMGGQLALTPDIENFPGYEGSGYGLIQKTTEQAQKAGATVLIDDAVSFGFDAHQGHVVHTLYSGDYRSASVILATGAVARKLNIAGEDTFFGKGVSSCATCDGAFFTGGDVVVVGGGDTAVEDALYMAGVARKVVVVHRKNRFRTDSPESRELLNLPNVEVRWNTTVESVSGDEVVTSIRLRDLKTRNSVAEPFDALFVAIGHNPATKSLAGTPVELEDGGWLFENDTRTNIPGVFAAGDVADSVYRQAVTAAATGAKAAMNAIKYNKTVIIK